MRKNLPNPNDVRIIRKFYWFPKVLSQTQQVWLEWIYVVQSYESDYHGWGTWEDIKEASVEEIYVFGINKITSWSRYTEFLLESYRKD